jgi:hypothetical protein
VRAKRLGAHLAAPLMNIHTAPPRNSSIVPAAVPALAAAAHLEQLHALAASWWSQLQAVGGHRRRSRCGAPSGPRAKRRARVCARGAAHARCRAAGVAQHEAQELSDAAGTPTSRHRPPRPPDRPPHFLRFFKERAFFPLPICQ